MIVCKEYEARISALIDDVLTIDERIEVLEHLDNCPACRAYWEDLLSLRDLLRAEETPAPVGFTDAVMARVRETKQEKAPERKVLPFPQWKRFAALAACCAVVLLGIWSLDLMPGVNNSMDMAALNGSAAPERATQGVDCETTESSQELPDVEYGVSEDGSAAFCGVPEPPTQDDTEEDIVKVFAKTGGFTAAVATDSEIAEEWVEDQLNLAWNRGTVYTISEAQYDELRTLLEDAGEMFTEITGDNTKGEYRLLAE